MFINVNFSLFCDSFKRMNRAENFTYSGLRALFDYLESIESDENNGIELDVIALCCEYSEYSLECALSDYNCESLDELQDEYCVIVVNDATIIIGG